MSSNWQYDINRCQEILNVLKQAESPDSTIQLQVTNTLNTFITTVPDASCYFALIFACMNNENVEVRQRAGLLLKNCLLQFGLPISSQFFEYIKQNALSALNDPNRLIRSTAGTIVTNFINLNIGPALLTECLHYLSQLLDLATPDSIDGALDCLIKICEDEIEAGLGEGSTNKLSCVNKCSTSCQTSREEDFKLFLDVSRKIILPKLFLICERKHSILSGNEVAVHLSFKCITLYAQHHLFSTGQLLNDMFPTYWNIIGILATDSNMKIRILVVIGILRVMEDDPNVILDGTSRDVIINFIIGCCVDGGGDTYNLRLEALEFWPIYIRNNKGIDALRPFLPKLLNCLLVNAIFTDFDYLEMDPSHFEDEIEDDQYSVGPRFHYSRGGVAVNDEDVDEVETGAWGNQWTVRKAAALALDHISLIYGDEILPELLVKIEQKLQDPNWEVRESAVLVLGAIARGCIKGLAPYLSKVITFLLKLSNDPKPLLRSISCWCIARFTLWLSHQQDQPILIETIRTLLTKMLDPNKRVEEAACSAMATFIEEASQNMSLIPFLEDIVNTLTTALNLYQYRNLLILCDTIATLCFSVGSPVYIPSFENNLLPLFISKWKSFNIDHPCLISSMDCLAKTMSVLRSKAIKYSEVIIEHCIVNLMVNSITVLKSGTSSSLEVSDTIECTVDLIGCMLEATGSHCIQYLIKYKFADFLSFCCQSDSYPAIQQSAFACVGDIARYSNDKLEFLKPILPNIFGVLARNVNHNCTGTANNAIWAIGELVINSNNDTVNIITPYIDGILESLIVILLHPKSNTFGADNLAVNSSITVGRISLIYTNNVAIQLPRCLVALCHVLTSVQNDMEKVNSVQGICLAIQLNPSSVDIHSIGVFFDLIASLQPILMQTRQSSISLIDVLSQTIRIIYSNTNQDISNQALQRCGSFVKTFIGNSLNTQYS
ncbi:HEAT repeat family protein [Cryptosporidium muris RN66]|uniref:HEAT repeat family protein n=1 Tax=Cryptosporidium muris (strain RN66) TaxID=441375 RepID=B6AHK1_CRYMR|nr:HEAT repeat family protein [Cryptosporidium muris RN66]EEA07696.1 HEAT repeat family protein [Cryptosporidium muris RN66]|eukprot:XP_002142045.1 HEAT repeat family protein [Cryptosporidium muris RN66]